MPIIALYAIAKKRREIERALRRMSSDRRALRRTLRVLDATAALLAVEAPTPVREPVVRPIYEALRAAAGGPLTARELTAAVMQARNAKPEQFHQLRKRTQDALYDLKARGKLAMRKRDGVCLWTLSARRAANSRSTDAT